MLRWVENLCSSFYCFSWCQISAQRLGLPPLSGEPNLRIRADPRLQTEATTPMQAPQIFLFVGEWIFQIFLFHLVSTSICRLSGEWLLSQSTLLRAGVTLWDGHHFPNTHFNVYYLKKKYECPLLSNFLHFSSGRSGVHCPSTSGHLPLSL